MKKFGDVRQVSGTPVEADFANSGGTPLVIDIAGGTAYYMDGAGAVQSLAGGGGGAPIGATYVVLSLDGGLTAERVLTAGAGISITDGGANGPVTIAATGTASGGGLQMLYLEGEPGEEGQRGAPGPSGPQGPPGPAIWMLADDGLDGQDGVPGRQGVDGAAGTTGAAGPIGPAVFLEAEAPDEPLFFPGPQGPQGTAGVGAFSVTRATVTIPYPAVRAATVNVVDAAITATSKVVVSLAGSGPEAENDADSLDLLGLSAYAKAGSMDVRFNFLSPQAGAVAINYAVST